MIHLENITKSYNGKLVLSPVNISIKKGQSIAFTGHNGSGKSTLLKIIAKLVKPSSGTVTYSKPLLFHYIPEHFPKMSLTAREYIKNIALIGGMERKNFIEQSSSLFEDFFIQTMLDVPMKYLSKGTLQKVGVIQALLTAPDVLLLDEPLSGQDIESQGVFIKKMDQLKERGVILLMSCHEKHLIDRISDTLYRIQEGKLSLLEISETQKNQSYILLFEKSEGAAIPEELSTVIMPYKGQYQLKVSKEESSRSLLLMLQNGWLLRGMYDENNG